MRNIKSTQQRRIFRKQQEKFDFLSHLMMVYFQCTHIIKIQFSCHIPNTASFPPTLKWLSSKSVCWTYKFAATIKEKMKFKFPHLPKHFLCAFIKYFSYCEVKRRKRRRKGRNLNFMLLCNLNRVGIMRNIFL